MCIERVNLAYIKSLLLQKDDERNLISATFHMIAITFICMSMGDLTWFKIHGNVCVPNLTLGDFFWFGYSSNGIVYNDYECLEVLDSCIVNMMRIIILMCFMAVIFSLLGFFLDIIGPKTHIYRMIRRYSVPGTCAILFIMTIVTMSYYVVLLLHNSAENSYSRTSEYENITYGLGFYFLTFAGGSQGLGIIYNLVLPYRSPRDDDDRCLLDGFDDINHFYTPTPPPPYSLPPPPYTP